MKLAVVLMAVAACGDNLPPSADAYCDAWHQWGGNPAHTGQSCTTGQPLERLLADVVIDSLVPDELANSDGDLIVHYQTPLIAGDSVFVLAKTGVYTPCVFDSDPRTHCRHPEDLYRADSQIWSEVGYAWHGNTLDPQWSFESDWKPPPGIEIMFQPAIVDTVIAIPAAHGAIALVDMVSGELVRTVAPFGDDANAYVAGALAVDHDFIYYNAVQVDHDKPYNLPMRGSLVAISIDDGDVRIADYTTLVPGAPAADDQCAGFYDDDDENVPLPWPPPPGPDGMPVLPKPRNCGPQVPGFNSAPAVAFDGTLYVVSHSEYNEEYSYITSVNPGSLTGNWATSLRDRLHDGCGVDIPYASDAPDDPFACSDTAALGIDPETGLSPAAAVTNVSSSSPVAMPQGGVLYGAFTFYNTDRGHLFELDADGGYVASYDFGWDTTPAVGSDGDRIYMKDNHYNLTADGTDAGPYYLTELDARLQPVWKFKSTDTNSCARAADGTVQCTSDHPDGFEWCINAPAIDRDGTMYANSEDGNLYAIAADGQLRDQFFLNTALGASYTPVALDHLGRIYALNAGHMVVVGAN